MKELAIRRAGKRYAARMKSADHKRLWRLIEGAVVDTMRQHPDYFTERGMELACGSITKRAVGNIRSAAHEAKQREKAS